MRTMPDTCRDVTAVRAFCDCIAEGETADAAAKAFCSRVAGKTDPFVTGENLAELKKALLDLEDRETR